MPDFLALFHRDPQVTTRANARVNLMGEHTDYNGGFVLPMRIPYFTSVQAAPRNDHSIRVFSTHGADSIVVYEAGAEKSTGTWLDYIQGVTWALGKKSGNLRGADLCIESDIPMGSGLSSSAALGVGVLRAFQQMFDLGLTDVDLALLCRESENKFVGAHVGIMDPLACLVARENHALFIDTLKLAMQHIAIPAGLSFIVMDTGMAHELRGNGYNTRLQECQEACRELGVETLRDVQDRPEKIALLPEKLKKRARHVILENQRVLKTIAALQSSNFQELGRLFFESHVSMRDDYEVSLPAIDRLVELCRNQPEVYGARLTGGGFGGAVVIAAAADDARRTAERIAARYDSMTGKNPRIWIPTIGKDIQGRL